MTSRYRVAVALACLGLAGLLAAQTITEFPVPLGAGSEITTGPDGNLWFTEYDKIGRITAAGEISEFPIPTAAGFPGCIAAGPDGNLWFTEPGANSIGRITTAGVVTEFPIQATGSCIAVGPDGNLWFTESDANKIGRITPAGIVTGEFALPTPASAPNRLTVGSDGNLWFTEWYGNKVGRLTTTGVITEFSIPTSSATPPAYATNYGAGGIAAGADGNLWFTEYFGNQIGRITTAGVITEYALPTPPNYPYSGPSGIAAGPDGSLWFTEYYANQIGRLTTTGVLTEFPVPTESSGVAGITAGPDGNLWFGEWYGIGRITTGPCASDARTLCLSGGRFGVTADWQVPSRGTSGHGTATRLNGNAGYFSFFDASNVEAVVKVLNGCSGATGHYWVFAAGLTNVAVTLTVTDVEADQAKTYTNADGIPFQPIQDTSAFATCP